MIRMDTHGSFSLCRFGVCVEDPVALKVDDLLNVDQSLIVVVQSLAVIAGGL